MKNAINNKKIMSEYNTAPFSLYQVVCLVYANSNLVKVTFFTLTIHEYYNSRSQHLRI